MSRGEVLALLDGLRGREHADRRPRGVARRGCARSPWVADAALRRVFPAPSTVVDRRAASRWASAGIGDELYPDRSSAARSSTSSVPTTPTLDLPIIDGLAAGAAPAGRWSTATRAALARPAACRRCSGSPSWRGACRRSTSATLRDAVVILKGDTALVARRRRAVRRAAAVVPRPGAGAARARRRTSTTSTCGSTSACTSGRVQAREPARTAGQADQAAGE